MPEIPEMRTELAALEKRREELQRSIGVAAEANTGYELPCPCGATVWSKYPVANCGRCGTTLDAKAWGTPAKEVRG